MPSMQKIQFHIHQERCIKCGLCIRECVYDVLKIGKDGYPDIRNDGENKCIHCQHCMTVCPKAAFSIDSLNPDDAELCREISGFDTVSALVKQRRSIRHFKPCDVRHDDLRKILEHLKYCPTGVNFRNLSFLIVGNTEGMNQIRNDFYRNMDAICREREHDESLNPFRELPKKYFEENKDIVFRTAPHIIFAGAKPNAPCKDTDPVIALSYFEMLAVSMNIGTVWCGRIMTLFKKMPQLKSLFGFPPDMMPHYAMLFGYPQWNHVRCAQPSECEFYFRPSQR